MVHIEDGRLVVLRVKLVPLREARGEGRLAHVLIADQQNDEIDLLDENELLLLLLVWQHHLMHTHRV